jgi:hypothetical protein
MVSIAAAQRLRINPAKWIFVKRHQTVRLKRSAPGSPGTGWTNGCALSKYAVETYSTTSTPVGPIPHSTPLAVARLIGLVGIDIQVDK